MSSNKKEIDNEGNVTDVETSDDDSLTDVESNGEQSDEEQPTTDVETDEEESDEEHSEVSSKETNTEFKENDFIVSKKTLALHYKTSKSISKKKEWICATVPNKIIEINNDYIIINNFCKSNNKYILNIKDLKYFNKCNIKDGYICNLEFYPGNKLKLSEFNEKDKIKKFINKIKNVSKNLPSHSKIKQIIDDKLMQIEASQGAPCDTIDKILNYDIEKLKNEKTIRTDNMIFNRYSRWAPPIPENYSYEEYKNSINFTRPIGIRPKDFCYPSEFISTMKELISQIICFKNVELDIKEKIIKELELDTLKCKKLHKCKWSGKVIDILDYSSKYASKDNFIEICHRDPRERFVPENMYWGFGESNREQGGYSEKERIKQVSNLVNNNPEYIPLLISTLNKSTKNIFIENLSK